MAKRKAGGMAARAALEELHGLLCQVLKDELTRERIDPKTGQKADIPASLLSVAKDFLKYQGVESRPQPARAADMLVPLPFSGDDAD